MLCVHGIAPTAEVDEVEQREVVLQLLEGDREAPGDFRGVEDSRAIVAAGGEEVREQCLQHAEALRGHRSGGPLGKRAPRIGPLGACDIRGGAGVGVGERRERRDHGVDELDRLERYGTPVLA